MEQRDCSFFQNMLTVYLYHSLLFRVSTKDVLNPMKFQPTFSILLEYALPGFFQPRNFSPCPEALPAFLGAGECELGQKKGGRMGE